MNQAAVLQFLKSQMPAVNFVESDNFVWSSGSATLYYIKDNSQKSVWALIHEASHALLGHFNYHSDSQLLKMESEAWHKAKHLADKLQISISQDHIEECLDTYRVWLHRRATCPNCQTIGLQNTNQSYYCFNCQTNWQVPASPICRLRRQVIAN